MKVVRFGFLLILSCHLIVQSGVTVAEDLVKLRIGWQVPWATQGQLVQILKKTEIPFCIADKKIVLVDDVLYTGRTIRAAMDALMDLGRPKSIQLVVLIDRGHRELPIQPDYQGRDYPTAKNKSIRVMLAEENEDEGVYLIDGPEKIEW